MVRDYYAEAESVCEELEGAGRSDVADDLRAAMINRRLIHGPGIDWTAALGVSTSMRGNSVSVTGSLTNSKVPGPSIDFGITFSAGAGGVTFSGSRNAYPSYEITRGSTFLYRGAETHPLRLFDATGMVRFSGP